MIGRAVKSDRTSSLSEHTYWHHSSLQGFPHLLYTCIARLKGLSDPINEHKTNCYGRFWAVFKGIPASCEALLMIWVTCFTLLEHFWTTADNLDFHQHQTADLIINLEVWIYFWSLFAASSCPNPVLVLAYSLICIICSDTVAYQVLL